MKIFFLKILSLLVPIIIFLIYIEVKLNKLPNSYSYKRQCLESELSSVEILILGSSQATYGINPSFFRLKGFNLSNISQSFYYDTQLTLKYIDKMPKLRCVIINMSYFSMGFQIKDGIEDWRDYYYYQFWGINNPELEKYDLRKYSKILLYTPQIAFSYFKKGFKVNLIENLKKDGYYKIETINNYKNINDSLGYLRVKFHENYYKNSRFKENLKNLELLLEILKRKNIRSIIITPPVLPTYSKFVNKEILKSNYEVIKQLKSIYKVEYFDYFTDKRFKKTDFYDNDHLNYIGAQKFSKIIDNEILN